MPLGLQITSKIATNSCILWKDANMRRITLECKLSELTSLDHHDSPMPFTVPDIWKAPAE